VRHTDRPVSTAEALAAQHGVSVLTIKYTSPPDRGRGRWFADESAKVRARVLQSQTGTAGSIRSRSESEGFPWRLSRGEVRRFPLIPNMR
jgi:hypothetical protein